MTYALARYQMSHAIMENPNVPAHLGILMKKALDAKNVHDIHHSLTGVLRLATSRPHDSVVNDFISRSPDFIRFLRGIVRNETNMSIESTSTAWPCEERQAIACELISLIISKCSFDLRKLVVRQLVSVEKEDQLPSDQRRNDSSRLHEDVLISRRELQSKVNIINQIENEKKKLENQVTEISNAYNRLQMKFKEVTEKKQREVMLLRKENALLMNQFGLQMAHASNQESVNGLALKNPPKARSTYEKQSNHVEKEVAKTTENPTHNPPRSDSKESAFQNLSHHEKVVLNIHGVSNGCDIYPVIKKRKGDHSSSIPTHVAVSERSNSSPENAIKTGFSKAAPLEDSGVKFSQSEGPNQRNHAINACRWKKRSSRGKISKTDLRVAHLPPVQKCTRNKFCRGGCETVTQHPAFQQRLRDEYCDFVREHDHHAGNQYLARFLHPIQSKAKESVLKGRNKIAGATVCCIWCETVFEKAFGTSHEWSRESCDAWVDSQNFHIKYSGVKKFNYSVPWINENGQRGQFIELCAPTFQAIYGLSSDRMTTVRKVRLQSASFETMDRRSLNGGHNAKSDEEQRGLEQVLESEPSSCAKSLNGSGKITYLFNGNLSRFHFWRKYLLTNGNIGDVEFVLQSERLKFYPTFHNPKKRKRVPTDQVYLQDKAGKQLKPSIAYTTACTYWKKFDIRFAGFEDSASLNGSSVKSDSSDVAE